MSDYPRRGEPRERLPAGLPLGLAIAAVLLMASFQTIGVMRDHATLASERFAQQAAVDQGQKLRTQLQALASQTADLANSGDTAARDVVDYMHRAGVTMTPSQAPASTPPGS